MLLGLANAAADFNECKENFLSTFQIPTSDCLISLSSVLIGYCLMTFAFVVKLLQILKIHREKSTAGITEAYFYIDFLNILNVVAWFRHYAYPFNTYGDSAMLLFQ
jgi:PQ loop repeat